MKITMKITDVELSEGVSQRTGNTWRRVKMLLEKPGMFPQRAQLDVLDSSEGFTKLERFNLQPGMIKTFYLRFRQSEWNGKLINNIDVMNVVDATERELNDQEL